MLHQPASSCGAWVLPPPRSSCRRLFVSWFVCFPNDGGRTPAFRRSSGDGPERRCLVGGTGLMRQFLRQQAAPPCCRAATAMDASSPRLRSGNVQGDADGKKLDHACRPDGDATPIWSVLRASVPPRDTAGRAAPHCSGKLHAGSRCSSPVAQPRPRSAAPGLDLTQVCKSSASSSCRGTEPHHHVAPPSGTLAVMLRERGLKAACSGRLCKPALDATPHRTSCAWQSSVGVKALA